MAAKDPKLLWRTALAQIEIKLDSPATYKTFFSGTELLSIDNRAAVVGVSNAYIHDWLKQKYAHLIQQTISHVYGRDVEIDFTIQADYEKGSPKIDKKDLIKSSASQAANPSMLEVSDGMHESVSAALVRSGLNEKYSLSGFVVGQSNQIAHAAAQAVIREPGHAYNPFFIHGKTGVGKTHLAQAIGRAILERNPHKKIVYVSAEGFLNDLVKAIRTNKTIEFRNRYRPINMLIIDDIQLISKWVEAQTEFFNTFNELYNNNMAIILVCDRPPEEIKNLEDRLRSRFQGGMVADISQPELELRLAILEKKALAAGFSLQPSILDTIARGVSGNVRELEGALQKVALFNSMKKDGDLSLEEVSRIIGADSQSKREKVKVPSVLKAVSKHFQVTVKDLKGTQRTKEIALARQTAMYILREELGYNLQDVAEYLQRSDHTTVMHAVDKIKSSLLTDEGFKNQVVKIVRQLQEQPEDE